MDYFKKRTQSFKTPLPLPLFLIAIFLLGIPLQAQIKLACVGNSITSGEGTCTIRGSVIHDEIIPKIKQVALDNDLNVRVREGIMYALYIPNF